MADDGEHKASSQSQDNIRKVLDASTNLSKPYRQVLEVLEKANRPLGPSEISTLADVNKGSCRVYVRELLRLNYVHRTSYGKYVLNRDNMDFKVLSYFQHLFSRKLITNLFIGFHEKFHGFGIHYVQLICPSLPQKFPLPKDYSVAIRGTKEKYGDTSIYISYGKQKKNIIVNISFKLPSKYSQQISFHTLAMVIDLMRQRVKNHIGFLPNIRNFIVLNAELHLGWRSIRFTSRKLQLDSLLEAAKRVYGKA